jgi:CO/xanthine dehydrogenase FAD-binding subunit
VLRPRTLDEALALLSTGAAVPLAGATDLYAQHVERPPQAPWMDLTGITSLRGLSTSSGAAPALRIGALTTWRDLHENPLPPGLTSLAQAAREIGGLQIQQRGTLGGNLCNASPAADGVPPLLALDAQVELASLHGSTPGTRRLPLAAFLLGNRHTARRPDELLTAIVVPFRSPRARSRFLKLGARRHLVISIAMVAVACDFDTAGRLTHCGIAVGACGPTARRLPTLEAALRLLVRSALPEALERHIGPDAPDHLREAALAPLAPLDDVRGTAAYRLDATATMIRRAVAEIAAVPPETVEA